MRREVPLFLTFLFGAFFVLSNFIVWERWKLAAENVNNWVLVVIAFTYVLGVGNILRIHGLKLARREPGWAYSLAAIAGLSVMLLFGLVLWFLPQTDGDRAFSFRALKDLQPENIIRAAAPPGSGDAFDVRVETVLGKDANGDGSVQAGDEIRCQLTYSYGGAAPLDGALFTLNYDAAALEPLTGGDPKGAAPALAAAGAAPAAAGGTPAAAGAALAAAGAAPAAAAPALAAAGAAPAAAGAAPAAAGGTPAAAGDTHTPPGDRPAVAGDSPVVAGDSPVAAGSAPAIATTMVPAASAAGPPPGGSGVTAAGLVWNAGHIDGSWFGAARAGDGQSSVYTWFYDAVYVPMQSTMFALLAFFISSAAFRAFRIRSTHAVLLGVAALVVILGSVPVGEAVWGQFPTLVAWVMNCLQTAGKRGILIGAALGSIATGLKVIVGVETGYLSRD